MSVSYKRMVACYILAALLMFICIFRVFTVMKEEKYLQAAESESKRVVSLNYSRGTVFDCNMKRITNAQEVYYAVIFNNSKALAVLYNYFSGEETKNITEEVKKNGYTMRKVSRNIVCDGIYCIKAYAHADDSLAAKHIVGYVDAQGRGVSGLEAAFDELLSGEGQNTVTFNISGRGEVLSYEEPLLKYDYGKENCGVKVTIDKDIQQLAEQEAMDINCGALIVTDVKSGKIKAMVSRPDYKLSDLGRALSDENEPLLNRTLCTYNIGSVFKPIVAAAGYESGISAEINCQGYTDVDGLTFTCHNLGGHGVVDITDALKFSCNSFFYKFVQMVGAQRVLNLAEKVGFESEIYLAQGLKGQKGSVGDTQTVKLSKRALANLSIGQGELMLSPLAITNLYMAIANDGSYNPPSLVEGVVKNGKLTEQIPLPASVKLMSKATAQKLKSDLASVLTEDGTGEEAKPTLTTAAGKTGTAQTGVIKNGKKVTNSWFCGFFPFEEPKYAVTVLSENATGGCGHIFASLADAITEYEQEIGGN